MKAITVCTNRFDDDVKNSFVDLYSKVDSGASVEDILKQNKEDELKAQIQEEEKDSNDDEEDKDKDSDIQV